MDVVSERREALNAVLAALIPQHAGIPAVRSFLEISTGEDLKMQRQEEQVREEARRREEAQRRQEEQVSALRISERLTEIRH